MTAREARKASDAACLGLMSLMEVLELVKASCIVKRTYVNLPASPSSECQELLTKLGYGYSPLQRTLTW